jgi:hypothetical protein
MTKEKLDDLIETLLYDLAPYIRFDDEHCYIKPDDGFEMVKEFCDKIRADQRKACAVIAKHVYNNPPPMNDKFLIDEIIDAILVAVPE